MKKLFSKLMLMALTAMTFVACQDVPEPYDRPGTGSNVPGIADIPGGEGEGTFAVPFNAIAALNFGNKLGVGEVSKNYMYIKGKVSKLPAEKDRFENNNYGNGSFYISNDGGHGNEFYVYRANYLGNKKFASGDTPVKLGDEVIICAKITNYNGTIETNQGEGFVYELNGVNRGGEILPTEPSDPGTPSGDGTLANPFNVAAALAKCAEVGETGTTENVYAKGYVKTIKKIDTGFGNAEFTISDSKEGGNELTVYRALGPGNKKITDENIIKEGDEVIICGKLVNFKGNTPEFTQGCYIYSINGVGGGDTPTPTGEAKGSGTQADPYNPVAAINYVSSLPADQESETDIFIKGKVSRITNNYVADNYGNATFYISEDGAASNEFYCFRTLYLNNEKYTSGDLLKVGDEVVICGKVVNYKGNTPETVGNKAYLFSLTPGSGENPTPGPTPTGDIEKSVSGTTVTLTYTKATESTNSITADFDTYGWTNATPPTTVTLSDGTTIDFDKAEGSSAPAYYSATHGVRMYAKNAIIINGYQPIAKVVMECDAYNGTNYVGNSTLTATVSGNNFTVINDHSEAKGGVQLRVKTMTITYAQ